MKLDDILTAYIECALWSSTDNLCRCGEDVRYEPCAEKWCGAKGGGAPLDDNYDRSDIAPASELAMRKDCENFLAYCEELGLLEGYARDAEQFGHDFWLTRNGHGAGFWDRGDGELGEKLSQATKTFGHSDLIVGDDGKVHCS